MSDPLLTVLVAVEILHHPEVTLCPHCETVAILPVGRAYLDPRVGRLLCAPCGAAAVPIHGEGGQG